MRSTAAATGPVPTDGGTRPDPWVVAARVPDPELPVVGLADLGVLRSVEVHGERVVVTLTPTYAGCPALRTMRDDVRHALLDAGWADVEVRTALDPPWSTDDITAAGREALLRHGVSPPGARPERSGPVPLTLGPVRRATTCPVCGSGAADLLAEVGPTPCTALYRCAGCAEPYAHVKEV